MFSFFVSSLFRFIFRILLGAAFIWIGLLKIFHAEGVSEVSAQLYAILGTPQGFVVLGLIEIVIGAGLLINRKTELFIPIFLLHLGASILTFFAAIDRMMTASFPFLTIEGEFVLKNAIMVLAALLVTANPKKPVKKEKDEQNKGEKQPRQAEPPLAKQDQPATIPQ